MSRKILGLDIRENSLAAVLINGTLQGNHIEAFEYITLSGLEDSGNNDEAEATGEDLAADTSGDRLRKMLFMLSQKIDISGALCIASMPSSNVSYRNINVPFNNEKKIRQILHFELEPLMPGTVDDLLVDFKIPDYVIEEGLTPIVTASVKKGLLDSFEFCLKNSDYAAQGIIPGGCAAAWYLASSCDRYDDYLYVDIEGEICTLFLIINKTPGFIRSFSVDSENVRALSLQIRRTVLSFCEQYDMDYNPEALFGSGSFFDDNDIIKELVVETGMIVELTDFRNSSGFHLENRDKNAWHPALFDNAFALAYNVMFGIQALKFSESFFAIGKYVSEHKKQIVNAGILLLLLIIAGLGNSIFESYTVKSQITEARKEMASLYRQAFPEAKVVNNPYGQMKGKLKEARKNTAFQEKNSDNIRVIDILNEISKNIPDALDIEVSRFVLGSEDLKLTGKSDTYASVDAMKTNLEKIGFFKKVVISSTTNDKADNTVKFKLKIDI